jgi:hypothetical protein
MCFSEIDETKTKNQWGNFKCNCRIGWQRGPSYTHYDEIAKINDALRSRLSNLKEAWLHADNLHTPVEEFIRSASELTENILIAAVKGRKYGNSEEEARTETE